MSEGFSVDPDAVRASSQQVRAGADAVGEAAALLVLLRLDSHALGDVPAAGRLAAALQTFTTTHSDDQEHGSAWMDEAAENLTSTAALYQGADGDAAAGLRKAGGR
ncbi:type VII secretion target [Kutzneria sp. NPDC052558]|uniref:type VII secretion target n=1 Tax=Kutzneria sp. NPDC052558 TaxID=3364121 RepID=UPI0037CA3366